MRLTMLSVLLLGACSGGDGTDPDELVAVDPFWFWADGHFGYDADADQIISYTVDGVAVDPTVTVTLAGEAYGTSRDPADTCTVELSAVGPHNQAAWVSDAGASIGLDLASPDIGGNCDTDAWDASIWGDDPAATIAAWGWGLGVGPMDDEVREDLMANADWGTTYEPFAIGGGFQSGFVVDAAANPLGWSNSGVTFAYAFDSGTELTSDALSGIAAADLGGESPPTGAYVVSTVSILSGAANLAGSR